MLLLVLRLIPILERGWISPPTSSHFPQETPVHCEGAGFWFRNVRRGRRRSGVAGGAGLNRAARERAAKGALSERVPEGLSFPSLFFVCSYTHRWCHGPEWLPGRDTVVRGCVSCPPVLVREIAGRAGSHGGEQLRSCQHKTFCAWLLPAPTTSVVSGCSGVNLPILLLQQSSAMDQQPLPSRRDDVPGAQNLLSEQKAREELGTHESHKLTESAL